MLFRSGYWVADRLFRDRGITHHSTAYTLDMMRRPSFLGIYVGMNIPLSKYDIDEQHEFRTSAGRKVYDGKGLMPDIKVAPDYISTFAVMLYNLGYIEDFLDEYMRRNPSLKVDNKSFTITDADYEDFVKFMADKDVPYESQTRMALELLQKTSKEERYDSDFADDLKQIESKLKDQKMDNLRNYRAEIMDLINGDVVLRHNYYQGVVEHNLVSDSTVMKAIDVLRDGECYSKILSEQDTEKN